LDARNHIENRIQDLDFNISSGAAYHGGKLNGVHSRKLISEANKINAIEAFLLSYYMKEETPPMTTYAVHCGGYRISF
jgi:hypothetical protein